MVWFGIGLVLLIATTLIDYRLICQWASIWYVAAVGLLILVLVAGTVRGRARRWLMVGPIGIQPSEIAKLAILVTVAYHLYHRTPEMRRRWSTVWSTLAIVAVPQALIFKQPDLGSVVIFVFMTFGLLFAGGARVSHLILVALLGVSVAALGLPLMKSYQKARLGWCRLPTAIND